MPKMVRLDSRLNWTAMRDEELETSFIGRRASVRSLIRALSGPAAPDLKSMETLAAGLPGHFAAVIEGPDWVLAIADKVRGYPLFYAGTSEQFQICNSARLLAVEQKLNEPSPEAILELQMAGYVTGRDTFFKGLYQLRAGEMLFFQKGDVTPGLFRYYQFYSSGIREESEDDLIQELDTITDAVILRNMEDANGRTIWVPLSGGLDSRLVLCKLKQHGYDAIRTFSYGTPGNFDALRAGEVAEKLGFPWEILPTTPAQARAYFCSSDRKSYWNFADGLHVVPNLHAMFSLKRLVERGDLRLGDVVINGQSGDFIAGQHIPVIPDGMPMEEALIGALMNKHFNLRDHLRVHPESIASIRERITDVLGDVLKVSDYQELAKAYELWEWQERQSKRVVNGQRNYDWYGLSWELPLWEVEYLRFWERIPLEHKRERRLFSRYVEQMDFYGLFGNYKPFLSRWPRGRGAALHIGRALKAVLGTRVSRAWYRRLDWFSQYHYLYACIPFANYRRHCGEYKGPLAYFTDVWLAENPADMFAES